MKSILFAAVLLALTACTTAPPGPGGVNSAEAAIVAAEAVGGDEFAPVEMRFAREKLEVAKKGMEKQKYEVANYLIDQSEINSELAIEKSKAAKSRRQLNELQRDNEELEARLRDTFGDEFE